MVRQVHNPTDIRLVQDGALTDEGFLFPDEQCLLALIAAASSSLETVLCGYVYKWPLEYSISLLLAATNGPRGTSVLATSSGSGTLQC